MEVTGAKRCSAVHVLQDSEKRSISNLQFYLPGFHTAGWFPFLKDFNISTLLHYFLTLAQMWFYALRIDDCVEQKISGGDYPHSNVDKSWRFGPDMKVKLEPLRQITLLSKLLPKLLLIFRANSAPLLLAATQLDALCSRSNWSHKYSI